MDLVIAGFSLITSAPSAQAAGGADTDSATPNALFAQLLDQLDGSPPGGDTNVVESGESEIAARGSLLAAREEPEVAARGPLLAAREVTEIAARDSLLAARDESELAVGEKPEVSVGDSTGGDQVPPGGHRSKPHGTDETTTAFGDEEQEDERAGDEEFVAPVMWQSVAVAPQPVAPPPVQREVVPDSIGERIADVGLELESKPVPAADVRADRETDPVRSDVSRTPGPERRELPQSAVDFEPGVSPVESPSDTSPRAVTPDVPPPGHAARALARALARLAPDNRARPVESVDGDASVAQPAPLQQFREQAEAGQPSPGQTDSPRVTAKGAELAAALHRLAATSEGEVPSDAIPHPTSSKLEPRHSALEPKPDVVAGLPAVPQGSAVEVPPLPTPAGVPPTPQMPHAVEPASLLAAREATPQTREEAEIVPQLVRAMRTHFRAGIGEARIRLNPEHLGEVRLSIRIDGDRVSALLQVERPEVQKAIESQSDALRTGLAAQGFTLEHLSVNRDEQPRQSTNHEPEQRGRERGQPPPQRRGRKREHDQEFELAEG